VQVEAKIADLSAIRAALHDALAADYNERLGCANAACCPLPFAELADPTTRGSR
jgi:hypothetical protein